MFSEYFIFWSFASIPMETCLSNCQLMNMGKQNIFTYMIIEWKFVSTLPRSI